MLDRIRIINYGAHLVLGKRVRTGTEVKGSTEILRKPIELPITEEEMYRSTMKRRNFFRTGRAAGK
jgi:hypothetical protein